MPSKRALLYIYTRLLHNVFVNVYVPVYTFSLFVRKKLLTDTSCLDVPGKPVTSAALGVLSCRDVIKRWPKLCMQADIGSDGGLCCKACRTVEEEAGRSSIVNCRYLNYTPWGINWTVTNMFCVCLFLLDVSCMDEPSFMLRPYEQAEAMNCRRLTRYYTGLCLNEDVRANCCASCARQQEKHGENAAGCLYTFCCKL